MPWRCPACSTPIRRELMEAGDETPQPACVYRCAICRLPLVLSADATHMGAAPLHTHAGHDNRDDSHAG